MYYQSSAKSNDPSEPEVDRLKTLLDNLNHLRGKLKNFTVIDELGQPIGEISDLILDAGHQLNLVISQPDDQAKHPSVLLNGRRIKKVSVQTQSVFVDITKADVRFLPEYLLPGETVPQAVSPASSVEPSVAAYSTSGSEFSANAPVEESTSTELTADEAIAEPEADLQTAELVDWNEEETTDPLEGSAQDEMDFLGEPLASDDAALTDLPELELSDETRSHDELGSELLDESSLDLGEQSFAIDPSMEDDFTLEVNELQALDESTEQPSEGVLSFDSMDALPELDMTSDFMTSPEEDFDFGAESPTDLNNAFAASDLELSDSVDSELSTLNLGQSDDLDFSGSLESDLPSFNLEESETSLELGSLADVSSSSESDDLLETLPEMSFAEESAEDEWDAFDREVGNESTEAEEDFALGSLDEASNDDFSEGFAISGLESVDQPDNALSDLSLDAQPLPDLSFEDEPSNELGDLSGLELAQDTSEDEWAGFDAIVGGDETTAETTQPSGFDLSGLEDSGIDGIPASEEFSLMGLGSLDEPRGFDLGGSEDSAIDETPATEDFSLAGLESLDEPTSFDLGGLEDPAIDGTPATEDFSLAGLESLDEPSGFDLGGLEDPAIDETPATEEFSLTGLESLDEPTSFDLGGLEDPAIDETPATEEFSLMGLESLDEPTGDSIEEFTLSGMGSFDEPASDNLTDLNLESSQPLPDLSSLGEPEDTFSDLSGLGAEESLAETDEWTGFDEAVGNEPSETGGLELDASLGDLTFAEESTAELNLAEERPLADSFDNFSLEVPSEEATSPGLGLVEENADLESSSDLGSIAVTPDDDLTGLDLGLGDPDGENLSFIESPDLNQDDLLGDADLNDVGFSSSLEADNLSGLGSDNLQDDWALVDLSGEAEADEPETGPTFGSSAEDLFSDSPELSLSDDFASEDFTAETSEPEISLLDNTDNLDFSLEPDSLSDAQDELGTFSASDTSDSDEVVEAGLIDFDLSGLGEVTSSESENLADIEPDAIAFVGDPEEPLGGLDLNEAESSVPPEEFPLSFGDELAEHSPDEAIAPELSIDSEDTIGSLTDLTFASEDQPETSVESSLIDESASSFDSLPELHLPGFETELAQMPSLELEEATSNTNSNPSLISEEPTVAAFAPNSLDVTSDQALENISQPQVEDVVEATDSTLFTSDSVDTIVPLLEERLKVEYERRKIGEVVVRKRIVTRMVQVPVRYETLVIEQVGSDAAPLAEVDLSQGALENIDVSDVSGKPTVSGEFKSPKTASYVLDAIAKTLQHRCKKVRIEIELEDERLQKAYQDWLDQCSQM